MPQPTENLSTNKEINRGYIDLIRGLSNRGRFPRWQTFKAKLSFVLFGDPLRLLLLPLLFLTGLLLAIGLRVSLLFNAGRSKSPLHERALAYVDTFVDQYPLHFYPIVAKALELAYLKYRLAGLVKEQEKVVEVAIGEGTLSARLFGHEQRVTGLDLNPYSLVKASELNHVDRAIICDGLNPPIQEGSYNLLLSNNLLHHVTRKESTISNWSRVARWLLFNENTPFWASGWTVPYLLKKLGLRGMAARSARKMEEPMLQHLESKATLKKYVRAHCDIEEQVSFMSERTFFYSSLFSFFMRCSGPPTPALLKKLFLGPLRPLAIPMTRRLAELLIKFDAYQDRSTDTFVFFFCKSRAFRPAEKDHDLVCPRCQSLLDNDDRCVGCGTIYPRKDGMLFLLPKDFEHIIQEYSSEVASTIPAEHL